MTGGVQSLRKKCTSCDGSLGTVVVYLRYVTMMRGDKSGDGGVVVGGSDVGGDEGGDGGVIG